MVLRGREGAYIGGIVIAVWIIRVIKINNIGIVWISRQPRITAPAVGRLTIGCILEKDLGNAGLGTAVDLEPEVFSVPGGNKASIAFERCIGAVGVEDVDLALAAVYVEFAPQAKVQVNTGPGLRGAETSFQSL